MPYFTPEQIQDARRVDLLEYLRQHEPQELVHLTGNTYCTREHDSLKISNGMWYWWSQSIGGNSALDYLVKVQGLSFVEAVSAVLGTSIPDRPHSAAPPPEPQKRAELRLPPKHIDNRRAYAYLRSRGIHPEIINHCIKHGQIYEDAKHHNCVFVGYHGDKPKYGALRSTLTGASFKGDVTGSDKRFSFAVPRQTGERRRVCVFEAAIDALSYLTLIKEEGKADWHDANVLSLAGVQRTGKDSQNKLPPALEQYLKDNPHISGVVLCLDSDGPGREAAAAIGKALAARGYEVFNNPPTQGKDYNDQLRTLMAAKEIPAR